MVYYIDFGDDYKSIDAKEGDVILFRRGMFIRDRLYCRNGVSYGAYGEGDKPTFCGSVDIKNDLWEEIGQNIWKYKGELDSEVCNIVFGDNDFGRLRWTKTDLKKQGDYWDNCFGNGESNKQNDNHTFLLYSEEHPAKYYDSIECVLRKHRQLAETGENISISDISFINNGVHAIAGEKPVRNMYIKNCLFKNIGGSVWSSELKIRFGNGVECWNVAENVTVEDCTFDNIYDSGVTHQGDTTCEPADRFIIRNNVFYRCGMAAYEQRDVMPKYAEFTENLCDYTGEGLSDTDDEHPRRSEIWPDSVGHHIFMWRIYKATENGKVKIGNNTFKNAIYGKDIYALIDDSAYKQIEMNNNKSNKKEQN